MDLQQHEEKFIIPLKTRTVILQHIQDDTIDMEDVLRIDTNNIIGELLTFPVFFNRVGNLKGDIENVYSQKKMETDIIIGNLNKAHRQQLLADGSKATVAEVESAVMNDPAWKEAKMALFEVKKQADFVDSLYWSAKSKDKKLEAFSAKIHPEEFENSIQEGVINQVMIKYQRNLIE